MKSLWRDAAPLVLASKSSARQSLLTSASIPFEVRAAAIDERQVEAPLIASGADGAEIARNLARAKAVAVAGTLPGRLVLGADQTLCLEGSILSKPADKSAAVAQLGQLSGRTHELCSALCLARGTKVLFETVSIARLTIRPLSSSFIETYVALCGDSVLTSVGAYKIEGLGIHLFEKIEGDHSTILGLPLLPLLSFLRVEGYLLQ
jgi:septum formation protein